MFEEDGKWRIGNEGHAPGHHFIENDSKRINIRALIYRISLCLLRADISGRAHDRIRLRKAWRGTFKQLCNTEVGQEDISIRIDQCISRFQITMDDAMRMCITECIRQLSKYFIDFR